MVFTLTKSGSLQRERVNKNRCCKFSCALSLSLLSFSHTHTHTQWQTAAWSSSKRKLCMYTTRHKATDGHFPQRRCSQNPTVTLKKNRDKSRNIHRHTILWHFITSSICTVRNINNCRHFLLSCIFPCQLPSAAPAGTSGVNTQLRYWLVAVDDVMCVNISTAITLCWSCSTPLS